MTPKQLAARDNKQQVNFEFAEALSVILIAEHNATDSNIAISRSARRVRKRMKTYSIKKWLTHLADQKDPFALLVKKIDEIQAVMPVFEFLEMGYAQKP